MKRTLLLLSLVLSALTASAQISRDVYGMPLGTKQSKVFDEWKKQEITVEQSDQFENLYRVTCKDEKMRPQPLSADVAFHENRLFMVRYSYPKDHFQTIVDLIKMQYSKYQNRDDEQFKSFFDDQTKQFVNIWVMGENTILAFGIAPIADIFKSE